MLEMTSTELTRLILALRAKGWDEKEINDLFLFIGTGDKQYLPEAIHTKDEG